MAWLAPLLLVLPAAALAEGVEVECGRIANGAAPHIDGDLSDPAWQSAAWHGGFRQSVPDFDQPATEPTNVAFLLDDHNLYVAVRCDDSEPGKIRAQRLRHRDDPGNDDHIQLILDTYRDQVRGTVFVVNPLGAKEEGLVNGARRYTWDWDDVWDVRTAITDTGWQAELRIPLRVLRYGGASSQVWGVNVKRVVRRKQEESYLSPPPPPYEISSLNYAAALTGLELGRRERNLQVIPYALAGRASETDEETGEEPSRTISEVGLDVKYSITSDLTLDGTYNTDFAQVEADDERVNLTRFSLFYPEKREFFLENAQLFSFGGGGWHRGPDVTPFFSRRIGLYEEETTVPIDAGLRLTGKVGRQDVGVLSVRTAPVDEVGLDAAWYNVARVRRDLGGRSYVGAIITDSQRNGFHSTTYGADAQWYLTRDLSIRGDLLTVHDNQSAEDPTAASLTLDLTTDPWGLRLSYSQVDEEFEPDLGFVRREGYRKKQVFLRRTLRPGRWGIRSVSFRYFGSWYDSLVLRALESSGARFTCEVELENGDEIRGEYGRSFERLAEPFELDDELTFDTGDYGFYSSELSYRSDESRRWGFDAELSSGEFYDGDRTQLGGEAWVVFSRHLRAGASYSSYDISSDHGAVDWRLWAVRVDYTHSSNLSASSFIQHNSSNGATVANLRIRWILPHDSDLFLVLNDRKEEADDGATLRAREVALKVSYRFFL